MVFPDAQLYNPQILRRCVDTAMAGTDASPLPGQAGLFIILALSTQLLTAPDWYVGEQVSWTASNDMQADVTALLTPSRK